MESPSLLSESVNSIVNRLPAAVFEYSYFDSGRKGFTYISPYSQTLFGLSGEAMMDGTLSLRSFIHPSDRESFINHFQACLKNSSIFSWEGRVVTTKKEVWINALATPIKMSDRVVWTGILSDISARKQAEKNTREITQRLELAAKGSDLGIWDYDFRTNTTIINDRWAEIIGYPKAQLEEMFSHCEDFIHPDDRARYSKIIETHLQGESDYYEAVYRFQLMDGHWRWVMERGQAVERDKEGQALRTVGTLQDFENQKIEERIAKATEVRYSSLLESLPLGVGIHQNGVFVYVNSYATKIMGATTESDLVGKPIVERVHPDYRAGVMERIKKLMEGIAVPPTEEKFLTLQGRELMVETYAVPFQFNGKPAIQIVLKDLTEQQEVRQAIRKSETMFSQLFHNSPFGKVMLDDKGKVALVNKGFEKIFGFTQEELQHKQLNQFIVPDNLTTEGNDLDSLISVQRVVRIDTYRKRKSGEIIPVIVYGVPIQLENKTIGIFGAYVDMSEQKRTEEELKVRNAELDNFVYKVSHDLRAPLSSVLGLVNLARLEGNTDNLGDYIKMIGQKVKQLDNFISDVLSHSKNLKLDLKIQPIDFHQLIEQTFINLNYLKGADQIKKFVQIESTVFYSDPWRVGEIFRNLISNAIKYRDDTKEFPSISINIYTTAHTASIIFSDNGIGIEEKSLPSIFDMFYRATSQADGSGLGLYIVKNAVDKLGGTIKVTSTEGAGTSFELKLPNHILATSNQIVSE
jgi:PAS domain S-box-containing protein